MRKTVASIGWIDSCWYALDYALQGVSRHAAAHKYYIVAQPTTRAQRLGAGHGQSIQTREIFSDDPCIAQFPRSPDVIAKRFAQGARCYGAFSDNQLAGIIWLQAGEYFEDEIRGHFRWVPQRDAVWSFDVYVAPEHRIGMTFIKLWQDTEARLHDQGIRYTIGRISAFNVRSRASHQRMGWHEVGQCVFIVLGKWQWMLSSQRPYIHFSASSKNVPSLEFKLP